MNSIKNFIIRASYPNFYMVHLYALHGPQIFEHNNDDADNPLEGNKPGTVIYSLNGMDGEFEFPPRWYDMFYLLKCHTNERKEYLEMLLMERYGDVLYNTGEGNNSVYPRYIQKLEDIRHFFRDACIRYVREFPLSLEKEIITPLTDGEFNEQIVSHKGKMLMDLTRNSYPVPDFCILTAEGVQQTDKMPELLKISIHNLEIMTMCRFGTRHHPLVFALRCAMPQYIPGLMPTILNIGVTRTAYEGLCEERGIELANRVYLSNLHSLLEMLGAEHKYDKNDIELTPVEQEKRIAAMENYVRDNDSEGDRLLSDAHYQTLRLVQHVLKFYSNNQNLILTFMQGKQAIPALILHRMVWTIGNEQSYPGVLYSRHSRTGKGRQIESHRNIFGEEIMTGDVTSEDRCYFDRNEIKDEYPAVFHFDPLLKHLETRYKSPVTIEFAVESRPHQLSLFSVLQLNMSEMTGRAALLSAIDMYKAGQIKENAVTDLIKPYHLRQIVSASIDESSFQHLQLFGHALSVLPRTAISCTLCFSIAHARLRKAKGENVCLCQERFVPEDTITLNEVDAIVSMTPAAIHVVTACRGYGIPAFMDLNSYGIRHEGNSLINEDGMIINEYDKITFSSKRQTIYKGVAAFKPARFTKYYHHEPVELDDEEKGFFEDMRKSYETYQHIITGEQVAYIADINKLARIIRVDIHGHTDKGIEIVNSWYFQNPELYLKQVLESRMGDHQDQSRVFDLLTREHKVDFFKRAMNVCQAQGLTGLKAGSFMLGRFVAKPLPKQLWNSLSDAHVAFFLNEYVLYEKYQMVLQEVGEIKVARAHARIENDGIDDMVIQNFDLFNFVPLLYSTHDWDDIAAQLEKIEHQDNTHLLVKKLSQPLDQVIDMSKPWNQTRVAKLMNDLEKQQ